MSSGGLTYGDAKGILRRVTENGVCADDVRVMERTNEATFELMNARDPQTGLTIIAINCMATYDVVADGTTLLLPKELRNAIVAEILGGSLERGRADVRQGWYDQINPLTYVDPNLAHDNPMVDLGLVPDPDDPDASILRRKYDYPGLAEGATVRITGAKTYLPITSDADYLLIQNVSAVKLMMMSIEHRENMDRDGAKGFKEDAVMLLVDEVKAFISDPKQSLKRKAGYEADMEAFQPDTFGYFRARLALELPAGLQLGKSELSRLLESAERQLLTKGHPVGSLEEFCACVTGGSILAPERVKSIISADLCGQPLDLRNIFFQYLKNGPGRECAQMLIDEGEYFDSKAKKRYRRYRLSGVSYSDNMQITFVGKLKWVAKLPWEQMTIRNYEAIRVMCTAVMHQKAEKWPEYGAAKKEATMLLDEELKDYLAGQELTIPMSTSRQGWGFSNIGGVQ